MKENAKTVLRHCPLCDNDYHGIPATSRTDNETLICPDCGIRQSLESIGVSVEEQDEILATVHASKRN